MALERGDRLGVYEVVSAIGAGGMGEVYKARDTKLNRQVALRILRKAVAWPQCSEATPGLDGVIWQR